jgi:hypothetical protein
VLNIITDYFQKLTKIREDSWLDKTKKEWENIKNEAFKQLIIYSSKIFIKRLEYLKKKRFLRIS